MNGKGHLVVPYSLATNDAKLVGGPLITGRAWAEFLIDSLDMLVSEGQSRMMSVGLHTRVAGHPGRAQGLKLFLDHLAGRTDVWVCRRADLAAHWRQVVPYLGDAA